MGTQRGRPPVLWGDVWSLASLPLVIAGRQNSCLGFFLTGPFYFPSKSYFEVQQQIYGAAWELQACLRRFPGLRFLVPADPLRCVLMRKVRVSSLGHFRPNNGACSAMGE